MDVTLPSPTANQGGNARPTFFDDHNNIALYIVVPSIILVYGGCCLIYCVAKLRRYLHYNAKLQNEKNTRKRENRCSEMDHAEDGIGTIAIIDLTEL